MDSVHCKNYEGCTDKYPLMGKPYVTGDGKGENVRGIIQKSKERGGIKEICHYLRGDLHDGQVDYNRTLSHFS